MTYSYSRLLPTPTLSVATNRFAGDRMGGPDRLDLAEHGAGSRCGLWPGIATRLHDSQESAQALDTTDIRQTLSCRETLG